ncbi:hypothetical protein OC861_006113 [Tilletia horrida]|nr:hypothetical protein OC861_006113 [Tilletia horrida]
MNKTLIALTLALLCSSAAHTAPLRTPFKPSKDQSIKDLNANFDIPHFVILRSEAAAERRANPVPEALEEAGPAIDRFEHEATVLAPEAEAAVKEAPKKAGVAWKWLSGGILSGAVLDHFLHPLSLFTPFTSSRRSGTANELQRRQHGDQQLEERAIPFKSLAGGVIGGVVLDNLFFKGRGI